MITTEAMESIKVLLSVLANNLNGGIVFGISKQDTVEWTMKSAGFSMDIFKEGMKLGDQSTAVLVYKEKKQMEQFVPRSVYGIRLHIMSMPIVTSDGEAYGALSVAVPILHPVAASFEAFAPILTEMFAEGCFMYMTDMTKIIHRQPSAKFDIPNVQAGYELQEGELAYKVLQSKKAMTIEKDESAYGVPVSITCVPLYDVEKKDELVAALGIVQPKQNAAKLKEMSADMEAGLSNISSAIQELAASATEINTNEEKLNNDIKGIVAISDEINEISTFIKDIAEETKLLGLNAAIEAARSGEAGRGFGVVADEIRKLSAESKSTVPKINSLTEQIKSKVEITSQSSMKSLDASQEQAAATEEITSNIEEITLMSNNLRTMAANI